MYILGIALGAATAVVVSALLLKMIRKATHQEGTWTKYDERQQAARGKAYKYAYFTMLILTALALCWYGAVEGTGAVFPIVQVLEGTILAGILVFVSIAIWTSAYIGTNETFRSSLIIIAIIGCVNLVIGIVTLNDSDYVNTFLNLGLGVIMVVVCVEMILKNHHDKRIADEEEE